MRIAPGHFLYPANLLSLLRLALTVPITWLVAHPEAGRDGELLALIAVASVTDLADGYLSRRLGHQTDLGLVLDPLADKVVIGAAVAAGVVYRGFPVLVVLLLAYRDVLILVLGAIAARRLEGLPSASGWGKVNTAIVTFLCISFLIAPHGALTMAAGLAALATTVISGVGYYRLGERALVRGRRARWILRVAIFLPPAVIGAALHAVAGGLRWI